MGEGMEVRLLSPERLANENVVAFRDGARELPTAPTEHQLLHWAKRGIKADRSQPNSPIVTLEYFGAGKWLYTSHEAFMRFLKATNREQP